MVINPIIPIPLMLVFCILSLLCLNRNKKQVIIHFCIITLLFIINLRFMFPTGKSEVETTNLDVLFVLDTTISMNASDYHGNETRLSGAIGDCKYIMDKLAGSRFSLITFDNGGEIVVPYTYDTSMLKDSFDIVKVSNELYSNGTSLDSGYNAIYKQLDSKAKNENRAKIIFFLSDGEQTRENASIKFDKLDKMIDGGAVLGYGTSKGSTMKIHNAATDSDEVVMDKTVTPNVEAISKIDEDNLKKIDKDLGTDGYLNMNNKSRIKLEKVLDKVLSGVKVKIKNEDLTSYTDIYYIFFVPLLGLLIYKYIDIKRSY